MYQKHWFLAGLILVGISLAFAVSWRGYRPNDQPIITSSQERQPTWNILNQGRVENLKGIAVSSFIDQATFEAGWRVYRNVSKPVACERALGGVINHHALALDLLVHFFVEAKRCRPEVKTVIVVSPDHYLVGTSPITTHEESYLAYGKTIEIEGSRLASLREKIPSLPSDSSLFREEHGIGVLIPFVTKVWPDAKIVPFVVRSDINRQTSEQFAQWLREQSKNSHVFILVSSDMSHYLDDRTALKNDEKTKQAFRVNDEVFFWNAKDGFTDNGRGISIVMRALKGSRWIEFEQSISTRYQGSPGFTTSYLTGFWK